MPEENTVTATSSDLRLAGRHFMCVTSYRIFKGAGYQRELETELLDRRRSFVKGLSSMKKWEWLDFNR